MTKNLYLWLKATANRREYIRDQLKGGTPVFVCARPEGSLLVGVGHCLSKVFEIYDRHALAALGHPVDIEKVRQAAIEAAHMEGFNRTAQDVTLRLLISFALSATLKNSFEQIFSPPLMVEAIFAELGAASSEDVLVRVHYDGNHHYEISGALLAHSDPKREEEAGAWLRTNLKPEDSLAQVASAALTAWQALIDDKPFAGLVLPKEPLLQLDGKSVEAALLDRKLSGQVHYRALQLNKLKA